MREELNSLSLENREINGTVKDLQTALHKAKTKYTSINAKDVR